MMCKSLHDAGVDAPLEALEREIRVFLRRDDLEWHARRNDTAASDDNDRAAARRAWIIRVLEAYNAYTHMAGVARYGAKYSVDVTGLQTNFENWVRPEYDAILHVDRGYLAARDQEGSQRIVRTFVIDRNALPGAEQPNCIASRARNL